MPPSQMETPLMSEQATADYFSQVFLAKRIINLNSTQQDASGAAGGTVWREVVRQES